MPPVFSRSSPPPASPPLSAVFAGSFSARHPEAAVAPESLPTSVFVVGDDMLKLWRAGEGREGGEGEGRGGRRHITRHAGKARDPGRMSCGLIFSFPLSGCLCGLAGMATGSTLPPPLPVLPSSSLLVTHSSWLFCSATPPPFPLPHPTFGPSNLGCFPSLL